MKKIDELIRGERSAIKSIDTVLKKIDDSAERNELSAIREDHVRAADTLQRYGSYDSNESQSSGAWGSFSQAFAGGASLFGDKAALQALKVGEQHGINDYREALESDGISPELKNIIQTELLPNQERHLNTINQYL
jgi:hypothetical protein